MRLGCGEQAALAAVSAFPGNVMELWGARPGSSASAALLQLQDWCVAPHVPLKSRNAWENVALVDANVLFGI